ncbi:hypothetical protein EJ07DRAFT_151013 [Lizonia empirigonia]|nr:hypothetical protein EJ07DRAFT_151013 [Lizonia empirigonia]
MDQDKHFAYARQWSIGSLSSMEEPVLTPTADFQQFKVPDFQSSGVASPTERRLRLLQVLCEVQSRSEIPYTRAISRVASSSRNTRVKTCNILVKGPPGHTLRHPRSRTEQHPSYCQSFLHDWPASAFPYFLTCTAPHLRLPLLQVCPSRAQRFHMSTVRTHRPRPREYLFRSVPWTPWRDAVRSMQINFHRRTLFQPYDPRELKRGPGIPDK